MLDFNRFIYTFVHANRKTKSTKPKRHPAGIAKPDVLILKIMTKVHFSTQQALSLADLTQELYEALVLPYEKDSIVRGNLITVEVETEDRPIKISVAVQADDTVQSLKERFDAQLSDIMGDIDSFDQWVRDNYEHASQTQGYAFDSLTC